MSGTGHVRVQLDWPSLQQAENPPEYISGQAQRALLYNHRYSEAEVRVVAHDPLFQKSCEKAYQLCRRLAERRWLRDQKSWKKGMDPGAAPMEWRVRIAFHRPRTRGFGDREI